MPHLRCDEKGRILIPKEMRQKAGTEFHAVQWRGDIILIPVPKDPLRALEEMGRKAGLHKLSIAQIKKAGRGLAEKEVEEELREYDLRRR